MRTTAFIRRATFAFGLVAAFAMSAAAAAPASASRAVSWGNNQYGQLGNDTSGNIAKTPVQVCAAEYTGVVPCTSYLQGVKSVAASYEYSLALLENGTVVAWGENNVGQLGNNTTTNSSVPVHVCEPEWNPPNQYAAGSGCAPGSYLGENVAGWKVTAISAGICNAMALLEDGEVVTWGANNSACGGEGDLGNDTTTNSSVPVFVCEPNNTVPDCADASKRLGSGAEKVTQISTGGWHDLALLNTGTVLAWGFNYFGQLGNEESGSNLLEPAWVCSESATPRGYSQTNPCSNHMEVLSSVKEVSAGALSSLALLDNGTVRSWGNNLSSQLGDGIPGVDASEKNPLPVKVCEGPTQSTKCPPGAELDKVEAISASGSYGGLALRNGSYVGPLVSVAGWGNNYSGQLGDDAIPAIHQYSDPIEMFGSHGVEAISAGASDTLVRDGNAFDTGGYVEATGDNADGELGNGTLTSTDLLANVCAVRASSCRLGPYLEHAQDISTGSSHNLAVVPALCGPPTSPGDQGREGICNWYNDTSLLSPAGRKAPIILWGEITQQNATLGEVRCKTVLAAVIENPAPLRKVDGTGEILSGAFYECVSENCAALGGRIRVEPLNFPWGESLFEGGSPLSVRDRLGASSKNIEERIVCEDVLSTTAKGELEPEIGIDTGPPDGLNASSGPPWSKVRFGNSTGTLSTSSGAVGPVTWTGSLSYIGWASPYAFEVW